MTDHEAEIATLHQEATQLRARVKRLEAALRWYAEKHVYARYDEIDGILARMDLQEDGGRIAADALQESSE